MANKAMSLESMLDEERRDVLALLEGPTAAGRKRGSGSSSTSGRAASPLTKPQSPVRSMLDIDDDFVAWHSSLTSPSGVATSPRTIPVRSMLDFGTTPPNSPPPVRSMLDVSVTPKSTTASTPAEQTQKAKVTPGVHPRSLSDAAMRPTAFGPRSLNTGVNVEAAYQFTGILPSNPGGPFQPKRNTQAGKRSPFPSAMSEVVRGGDLSVFARDRGGRNSIAGTGKSGISGAKSRSPHNRLGLRSNSPQLIPDSSKFTLDDGREIDMSSAYKRLSDANLAFSGGNLSSLGKKGSRRRTNSGTISVPDDSRLQKDYTPIDGEDALDDSSDEERHSSDEERPRGRKMHVVDLKTGMYPPGEGYPPSMGRGKGSRTALSLLAAAEEERQEIAAQQNAITNAKAKYKIRSLLDPEITVTGPAGEKSYRVSKPGVHPNTSFDEGASGLNTPVDSDTEADLTDIKRAQKLSINMTSVVSTPATSRSVRTIYRGDFAKMQQEAHDNQRRVRKYLVATDLSEEAAHALEWTIGTVLRDGDTLLAIYCVDEELGIAPNEGSADETHVKEQVVAIAAATRPSGSTPIMTPVSAPSPLGQGFRLESHSSNASPIGREKGKQEQERFRAVQDITDRVARLLRKTKLQVKVVIEVIHCKSPKHLITEVIDYISPTLVILGSRGRSALKGVILGSFSNYLVTKSSVPVMVARKRLRKHTKYKRPAIRLANNLANPTVKKTLAAAKID